MIDKDFTTANSTEEILTEVQDTDISINKSITNVTTDNIVHVTSKIEETPAVNITVGEVSGVSLGTRVVVDHNVSNPNQHTIGAITGLREELDEIKSLKTVYSDKKQQADYYLWHQNDVPEYPYGLFVSIYPETNNIHICDGTNDVFGVTVSDAAFVGNQAYVQAEGGTKTGRDGNYCLVAHSGLVGVRRMPSVVVGDYVVPNSRGEAEKSNGDYGYLVTAVSDTDGLYAIISLNSPSTLAKKTADSVEDLSGRMGTAEYNITSVTNVANSAYAIALDAKENAEVNSEYIEEKISEVLGRMDETDGIVGNLSESVNNACATAVLAKVVADGAVSSANAMKDEAVAKANEALVEATNARKYAEAKINEINTELDNVDLELQATKESVESTRDQLKSDIDSVSSELEDTKTSLNSTRDELSADIDKISASLNETDGQIASITKKVDENEASINSISAWKDTTSTTIANIEQKTTDNASNISILTAWKSDVEDDVESIASIKTQSDANKSAIEGLTSWKAETSESLTNIKQQSDANKASINAITSWQGETDKSIAAVKQQADGNSASITNLTEWKDDTSKSISSIEQRVDDTESSITSLTSWQGDAKTSIANVEQKSNANESKINSLTSWQSEASESIANVEQKATDNESAIEGLTTWKGEATESIASIKQTADKNSSDISLVASWKSDVEEDVSSIASIKSTADANKASIEQLVKKDTELSTAIAGVKTTADDNKASIESITSWQSKVDPTINSVAGIKQTADDNAAEIEALTSWQGTTNTSMARIEQKADDNGAKIEALVANVDKYSVGEYSQAYGLSLGQAKEILSVGTIYVPTIVHSETYDTYTQEFSLGYYYTWNGEKWVPSQSTAVSFLSEYFAGTTQTPYWVVTIADVVKDNVTYDLGGLYKWENSAWVKVASTTDNVLSRAVSAIKQTTNSISAEVSNVKGDVSGLTARVGNNEASLQTVTSWKSTVEDDVSKIATIEQKTNDNTSSIALVVSEKDGEKVVNSASIVTAINDGESSVAINADHINFEGSSFEVKMFKAIDDIEIGGRNLIPNTDFDGETKKYEILSGGSSEGGFRFTPTIQIESGIDYVLSAKIRGTSDVVFYEINDGGNKSHVWIEKDNLSADEYKLFSITFNVDTSKTFQQVYICTRWGGSVEGDWFEIAPKSLKLEKGNKATDWTPAPEDMATAAELKITTDQMVAKVHNKESGDNCSWTMTPKTFQVTAVADGKTGGITIDDNGLAVQGKVTAYDGEIGGWSITDNSLVSPSGNVSLYSSQGDDLAFQAGTLYSDRFKDNLHLGDIIYHYVIYTDTADDITVSGQVDTYAVDEIGRNEDGYLYIANTSDGVKDIYIYNGLETYNGVDYDSWFKKITEYNHDNYATKKLLTNIIVEPASYTKIYDYGKIEANNGEFTGKITATSGKIGGCSIVGDTLSGGKLKGNTSTQITINDTGFQEQFIKYVEVKWDQGDIADTCLFSSIEGTYPEEFGRVNIQLRIPIKVQIDIPAGVVNYTDISVRFHSPTLSEYRTALETVDYWIENTAESQDYTNADQILCLRSSSPTYTFIDNSNKIIIETELELFFNGAETKIHQGANIDHYYFQDEADICARTLIELSSLQIILPQMTNAINLDFNPTVNDEAFITSTYFTVSKLGKIEATKVNLSGTINADSGTIGDLKLEQGILKGYSNQSLSLTLSSAGLNLYNKQAKLQVGDITFYTDEALRTNYLYANEGKMIFSGRSGGVEKTAITLNDSGGATSTQFSVSIYAGKVWKAPVAWQNSGGLMSIKVVSNIAMSENRNFIVYYAYGTSVNYFQTATLEIGAGNTESEELMIRAKNYDSGINDGASISLGFSQSELGTYHKDYETYPYTSFADTGIKKTYTQTVSTNNIIYKGNLIPIDSTYSIGSANQKVKHLYVDAINGISWDTIKAKLGL